MSGGQVLHTQVTSVRLRTIRKFSRKVFVKNEDAEYKWKSGMRSVTRSQSWFDRGTNAMLSVDASLWGHSKQLHRSEAALTHKNICSETDVSISRLNLVSPPALEVLLTDTKAAQAGWRLSARFSCSR